MSAIEADITVLVGDDPPFGLPAKLSLDSGVLVLFGPSGSGKSLTLQSIVGVHKPIAGKIVVDGRTLFDHEADVWVPPHLRRIGYVPQHDSLFPFCSVRDNIAFGLSREERRGNSKTVDRLIDDLDIAHLRNAKPTSLSGGERQRVALARALAVRPVLLVLDEPFASIDVDGRAELRAMLRKTLESYGTSALFVTHDPAEARELGDRVVRFERGKTTASGTPEEVL